MPAQKSSFTATEIKAGVFVLASLAMLVAFLFAIRGLPAGGDLVDYRTEFSDTLGLNPGADVRFGGARVGRVVDIRLAETDQSRIQVVFAVDPVVPVNQESVCYIGQTTLTSERHLEVSTGKPDAPRLEPGALLPSESRDIFGLVGQLGGQVSRVLESVNRLLEDDRYAQTAEEAAALGKDEFVSVPRILADVDNVILGLNEVVADNRPNIDEIIQGLRDIQLSASGVVEKVDAMVAENRPDVRSAVESVRAASAHLADAAGSVDVVISDVQGFTNRLEDIADALDVILANATALSDDLQGLVAHNRPEIDDLMLDLRETVQHARELTRKLRDQPQSVIMGEKPVGRKDR